MGKGISLGVVFGVLGNTPQGQQFPKILAVKLNFPEVPVDSSNVFSLSSMGFTSFRE